MVRILAMTALAFLFAAPLGMAHASTTYEVTGQFASPSGATLSGQFTVASGFVSGFDFDVTLPSDPANPLHFDVLDSIIGGGGLTIFDAHGPSSVLRLIFIGQLSNLTSLSDAFVGCALGTEPTCIAVGATGTVSVVPEHVPEPVTLALVGLGLSGLALTRGRRNR